MRNAVGAVKTQNTKWAASVLGGVAEAGKKSTEENQTKGGRKSLGFQAPAAAQLKMS